ncbi:retroviral-like aspartic protease family protein [Aquiflexum sp. TKW24L]|uniref:retropepsin-like aspartic protease n=1 Tax=Aquiflexum sp. TKW24L TaxID=2942212 RepID=UPI0020BDFEEA|nr:retropepsin-like aspartic protease [Aquiflexum sp. TKW24L]MCL6260135.1 retroviral-like aspartic protease family protein [Aquiflexum sp. TKW24L]
MKRFLIVFFALLAIKSGGTAKGQTISDSVYSLPFHIDAGLLVFKGQMNGVETDFAFDTGASIGLANSLAEPAERLKVKGKKIKMRDSNKQVAKVPTGLTKEIQIGGITFPKVRSLVNDMAYLYCMDYYLLGSDIIRQLNWEIDFENSVIRFSKTPFSVENEWKTIPVYFFNKRPFVTVKFVGQEFENVLIDTGYTQFFSFPAKNPSIQDFLSMKDSLGLSNPDISSSMGALSFQTDSTRTILVDSLQIGENYFGGIPVSFEPITGPKLGIGFFKTLGSSLVINNSESTYHLRMREEVKFKDPIQVGVHYQEGKLVLMSKSIGAVPQDALLNIGEEIEAVNGRRAEDFADACDFMRWSFTNKPKTMTITKLDGTSLVFEPIRLK